MARQKADWKFPIYYVRSLVYTEGVNTPANVPAIDGRGEDGRRVFLTFDTAQGVPHDAAKVAERMRTLAATLTREADRLDPPAGDTPPDPWGVLRER